MTARAVMSLPAQTKMFTLPVIVTCWSALVDDALGKFSLSADAGDFDAAVLGLVFAI